jgi:hypothetical protein
MDSVASTKIMNYQAPAIKFQELVAALLNMHLTALIALIDPSPNWDEMY